MGSIFMVKKDKNKDLKNSQINTPHDSLFRKSMKIRELAKEFLKMHLSDEFKNNIDYNR